MNWDSPGKNTGLLPFLSPRDLPDPRVEPASPANGYISCGYTAEPQEKILASHISINHLCLEYIKNYYNSEGKKKIFKWAKNLKREFQG